MTVPPFPVSTSSTSSPAPSQPPSPRPSTVASISTVGNNTVHGNTKDTATTSGFGAFVKNFRSAVYKAASSAPSGGRARAPVSSKEHMAVAMQNAAQIDDDRSPADKSVMRQLGSSSRSAGVKPRRAKSSNEVPSAKGPGVSTVDDYAVTSFPFAVRTGFSGPIAGPSRGGFVVKTSVATPVLSGGSSADDHHSPGASSKPTDLGKRRASVQVTEATAGSSSSSIPPPSQILPLIHEARSAQASDSKMAGLLRKLSRSVASYPFPPPPVSASNLASALAGWTKEDDIAGEGRRKTPAPTPLQIYLSQADLLTKDAQPEVRSAMLELMMSCLKATMESTGGMKESEKAVYWDEVLRWSEEAKHDVKDSDGSTRRVLSDQDREHCVAMLRVGTRGGRDLTDVPRAIDLLCSFIEDSLPNPSPPSPLFDETLSTPFVRFEPPIARPYTSALVMLTAFHKFCAPHIPVESAHKALQTVLAVAKSPIERDIGSPSLNNDGGSVMAFLDTVVKFGEVTGGRVARERDGGRGNAILQEVVSVVTRIIGCEGFVGVVELAPQQPVSVSEDKIESSFLPPIALDLMRTFLRSPAHLALRSMRQNLSSPPPTTNDRQMRPVAPVLLLVGTIRALRFALRDFTADMEANPDAQSSLDWSWPSAFSLGLPFFYEGLRVALDWENEFISAEALQMIDERIEASSRSSIRARKDASYGGPSQALGPASQKAMVDDPEYQGISYEEWDIVIEALERTHGLLAGAEGVSDGFVFVFDRKLAHPVWFTIMSLTLLVDTLAGDESDDDEVKQMRRLEFPSTYNKVLRRLYTCWTSNAFSGHSARALSLFVQLSAYLPTSISEAILSVAHKRRLLSPPYPDWLQRTQEVVRAFYEPASSQVAVKLQVLEIVSDLYQHVCLIEPLRSQLAHEILLPLLERSFALESNHRVASRLSAIFVQMGRDDASASKATNLEAPSSTFDIIRVMLLKHAKTAPPPDSRRSMDRSQPTTPRGPQRMLTSSTMSKINSSNAGSPVAVRGSSLQPESVLTHLDPDAEPSDVSMTAVIALIDLFTNCVKRSTKAAAVRATAIFRDLLALLQTSPTEQQSTASLKSRLVILQWLVRLRADAAHRIHVVKDVDISDAAAIISRTESTMSPSGETHLSLEDMVTEARGRSTRTPQERGNRSLSGSRIRMKSEERSPSRGSSVKRNVSMPVSAPLWSHPEVLPFQAGDDCKSFGYTGLVSFDHNRMRNWKEEEDPGTGQITFTEIVDDSSDGDLPVLPVSEYLATVVQLLQHEQSWELVSLLLCHLPQQLSNKHFACGPRAAQQLHTLRRFLCAGLSNHDRSLLPATVLPGIIRKTEVHALGYGTLSALIPYSSLFSKAHQDEMVYAFMQGLNDPRTTAKPCIHAIAMASFAMKPSVTKHLSEMINSLQKIISSASLGVHILELMAGIGQMPALYANFTEVNFQTVFAIACKYIQSHNERLMDEKEPQEDELEEAFSQYVFLLAYYVIAAWFLAIRLSDRPKYVEFLTRRLVQANEGKPEIDEPTEVCFDMIARYAYTNADPRPRLSRFDKLLSANRGPTKAWVMGHAIVSVQKLSAPGWVEITVRRPSGVLRMMCEMQNIAGINANSDPSMIVQYLKRRESIIRPPTVPSLIRETLDEFPKMGERPAVLGTRSRSKSFSGLGSQVAEGRSKIEDIEIARSLQSAVNEATEPTLESGILTVDPSFFVLQLSTFPEFGSPGPPIMLPEQDVQRHLASLDRMAIVDLHRVGVLYVAPGQTDQHEILNNVSGSLAYTEFITCLGKLVRLKGSRDLDILAGGLDQYGDTDGKWTYSWDDDISQIVFHVATLMPNQPAGKIDKMVEHIGNDMIKIVWNESGGEYNFETIPGQFNFVNIVIEPHTPAGSPWSRPDMSNNNEYFKVSMQCRPGMPEVGPLDSFKMVDGASLPDFVRQISLHSSIFAQVWLAAVGVESRGGPNAKFEFVSNWRNRLQQIKRTRSRALAAAGQPEPSSSGQLDLDAAEAARQFTAWLGTKPVVS